MENFKGENITNLYTFLYNSARKFGNKTAVIDEKDNVSYEELLCRADILAEFLGQRLHIESGDRVGVIFFNCIDFYIAFYALMKIRAIAVMVNTKMHSEEIEFILRDTSASCVIGNDSLIGKIEGNLEKLQISKIITDHPTELASIRLKTDNLDSILADMVYKPPLACNFGGRQQTAVIMHTSGTTGRPKGIMLSHKNMIEAVNGYQKVLGVDDKDTTVLSVPVFHILGLSCVSNLFISIGGTIVVIKKYDTLKVLEKITSNKATHFHSVPAVYIKMLEYYAEKFDLSSLKIAVCGGDTISEECTEAFCEIAPNSSFRTAYGLTETSGSGVLSYAHRQPGRITPNCRLKIWDADMNILKDTGTGEAVFEGGIVSQKIWGEKEEHLRLFTGDIVEKDESGYISVRGRIKTMINRGGEKIFPYTIEEALKKYPHVEHAYVFGIWDKLYGEVPMAVLTAEQREAPDIDFIKKDLPNHIGKYELPRDIELWDISQIPYTENGKVKKAEMQKIYERRKTNEKA